MPTYNFDGFLTAAAAVVRTTWGEVVTNGIWEMDRVIRQTWEARALPFAVFEVPFLEPAEWGIVNEAYEFEYVVHYVAKEGPTAMTVIRTKLEALKSAMWATDFTSPEATMLETSQEWGRFNELNAIWYEKNINALSGSLRSRFTAGTTFL